MRWGGGLGLHVTEDWWPDMFEVCPGTDIADVDSCLEWGRMFTWCHECPAPWGDFVWKPAVVYLLLWAVPYYIIFFCCCRGCIERNGKDTLYDMLLKDPGKSAVIRLAPPVLRPVAYMCQHLVVVLVFGFITFVFWHNFVVHTCFLAVLLIFAIHNGSTYMFRVFGMRYAESVLNENYSKVVTEEPLPPISE
eukprot:gnl/TRDRNA2_/TRDRNA2_170726_c0_seq4.p1 gnl/TRDRNA2_/TRDRNA2_170726_c0~~gnl/TRDRNA2_/TRDRNA2_170726_c0_seq4.p1  ORF type:complete len:192 (+),score=20.66 gnl/TRDRNA2_/TRDRNA2_170726_c0_seq4:242-817(+)